MSLIRHSSSYADAGANISASAGDNVLGPSDELKERAVLSAICTHKSHLVIPALWHYLQNHF